MVTLPRNEQEPDTLGNPADYMDASGWNTCPVCDGDDMEYKGEGYDEDEHLGSCYECNLCGHRWTEGEEY